VVLIDKSAFSQAVTGETAREVFRALSESDALAICSEIRLEALYSARNFAEYKSLENWFVDFTFIEPSAEVARNALAIQRKLARRGQHRIPIEDITIAATAQVAGVELLHYDKHFDLIAEVSSLRATWIIPRGSGH
jgi:predicted nucleic acid-binding protein